MDSTTEIETMHTEDAEHTQTETQTQTQGAIETESASKTDTTGEEGEKRRRINASEVWEHFTKLGDGKRAACNYCGNSYASDPKKNGTSTIKGHMVNCTKGPFYSETAKGQSVLALYKKQKHGEEEVCSSELVAAHWTKKGFRRALAKYVVLDELPFRHVEGEGFREYSRYLNPKFVAPSRITVAKDIVNLYEEERLKLKKLLKPCRISVTTDTWTSIQNMNYMCVTAHWIDDAWVLQKRIIGFFQVPNHKGDTVANELVTCFNNWDITKIGTVTMDNASSNDVAIEKLKKRLKEKKGQLVLDGDMLHMRCVCHITNLIVSDGLKEIAPSIASIRNAVRYVRSSPARFNKFKEVVADIGIDCKALLCLDVPTRWNSTYLMLEAALKYQKVFDKMEEDLYYRTHFEESHHRTPVEADWENAATFVRFLKTFYDLTMKLSGTLYATSNICFDEVCEIKQELISLGEESDELLRQMAGSMEKKFDKYWGNPEKMNLVMFVGLVLDPRYKLEYVQHCLKVMYGTEKAEKITLDIDCSLKKLYNEYNDIAPPPPTAPKTTTEKAAAVGKSVEHDSKNRVRMTYLKEKRVKDGGEKNDVERYLAEGCEDVFSENFDVLEWWKANSNKYKMLSRIARDVLAVPMSTVASESAFSTSGRILDPFRSSLTCKMVERLICCKSWLSTKDATVVRKEYMDEIETLMDSIKVETDEKETSNSTIDVDE